MNEIIVLSEGYSYMDKDDDSVMVANCTCTLIKSHDCNIIVDTMTPWDGDLLLQRLQESNLNPDDIDWVVSTHGHSDHLGNNNLFLKAKHIVGTNISQRNHYFIHDFSIAPYRLSDTIEIVQTPGHTLSCVSLLVRSSQLAPTGLVAIVGDLFERRQDIDDERLWLDAGSENPTAQRQQRAKIAAMADVIIPGHGAPFPVDQQLQNCLMAQILDKPAVSLALD